MSKSYKKSPIVKDYKSAKSTKRLANKKVRMSKYFTTKGKQYKKLYESYNIHDYRDRCTLVDYIKTYESNIKALANGVEYKRSINVLDLNLQWWLTIYKRK